VASSPLADAALSYARRGWRVFPLHNPVNSGCSCGKSGCDKVGKHPRTPHGLNDGTTDAAQIRRWWRQWPDANIGTVTGAVSGFVVLDVDPRHGGDPSLEDLTAKHGSLPDTTESLTGGGGRHLLFAHPGTPIHNDAGKKLGAGLDIRGDGGYVVVPPSRHASGQFYEWEASSHPNDVPLAPMPAWLVDRLREHRTTAPVNGQPSVDGAPIADGQRNVTLTSLAGSMRRRAMTADEIHAALAVVNLQRCQPPLPDDVVRRIAASVSRYIPANSQTVEAVPLSDQFNAEALVAEHGADLRYCFPWGKWLVWTPPRWQVDHTGAVMRRAKQAVKGLARTIETLEDTATIKAYLAHIKSSLAATKLKAMLELATAEPGVPVLPDELDRDPWALNVQNGTLDLRNGALRPHECDALLTKLAPVAYNPEAACPRWEQFLLEIFQDDQELVRFIQRAVGYSLTGDTRERALFICYGLGRNGKSTFIETLAEMLGDYAQRTPTRTIMEKRNPDQIPNDVAALKGMRFVHASESGEGQRLDEEFIKDATGRDTLAAQFLHGEWFNFQSQFKLWLRTNHKPVIRGTDPAIWDRPRLIPFLARFSGTQEDRTLATTLRGELSGILRWAVKGCLSWQIKGLGSAKAVEQATSAYRREMDVIGDFLMDCCTSLREASVASKALTTAYIQWCEQNGEKPLTSKALAARLRERGYEPGQGTSGVRLWRGIGLTTPPKSDF
jgi:putative DNA primase/helicase